MITTFIGKAVYKLLSIFRDASSFPGKVVLKLDKNYLSKIDTKDTFIIFVTGTNGKTSTTKYISEYLNKEYSVLTNKYGANIIQGITTAVLTELKGNKIKQEFTVLEVDELYLGRIVEAGLVPNLVLVTNLYEDQLDRMGSLDRVKGKIFEPLNNYNIRTITTMEIFNESRPFIKNFDEKSINLEADIKSRVEKLDVFKQKNFFNALSVLIDLENFNLIKDVNFSLLLDIVEEKEVLKGRMQKLEYKGQNTIMNLVKNKAGLDFTIKELEKLDDVFDILLNIGRTEADGLDQSWILNYDFNKVKNSTKANNIFITGEIVGNIPNDLIKLERIEDLKTDNKVIFLPNYSKIGETFNYIEKNK